MLLKHSWAEGRTGKKNNDKFTKTSLDTNEGLSYNQDVYRKIHHSYSKTSESFRNNIARDIHIDKSAYDTLLRNKEKNNVVNDKAMSTSELVSPNDRRANVKSNSRSSYHPLGYTSYSNSSYTWRPRHSSVSATTSRHKEQLYRQHKVKILTDKMDSSTICRNNKDSVRTKIMTSPVKVVITSSVINNNVMNNKSVSRNDNTISANSDFSSFKRNSSFLLARRLEKPPNLINSADVHNYALQSKVAALEKKLEESRQYIQDLEASEIDDALTIDHLGLSHTTFEPAPATEFHGGRTGIYGKLWNHAGYTKTFKYSTCWEPCSPRHTFLRRKSLASPNHKIVTVLKKEEGLDETIDDPEALKRPKFTLNESQDLLNDLNDLKTVSLFRSSTELFQKHYVYPARQHNKSKNDLTGTLTPFLLMKVFENLSIGDLRGMACTEKRMVLWTSCPVLWGRLAYSVTLVLEIILDCVERTEESYLLYRKGKKELSLVTNECIKEVAKKRRPERIVRDVATALGLLLHGSTDPFSQIRTSMDPPVQMPLISWPSCQRMLSKKNFLRKLLKHNPANFKLKRLKRLRPFISHDHLKPETVKKHNIAFSKLANWMHTSSAYCIRQRHLDRLGSKIRDDWYLGKAIIKESKRRKKMWEKCEDGWLKGLYAYNTLI